jgi:hypothetical protein
MPRKSTTAPSRALVPVLAPAPAPVPTAPKSAKAKPAKSAGRKKGTPKTGGRKKGSLNKTTVAMKDAMLSVYADLQAEAGGGNGHFLDWARGNSTDFYRLAARLLPLQVSGEGGGPVVTRIELVGVEPPVRRDER